MSCEPSRPRDLSTKKARLLEPASQRRLEGALVAADRISQENPSLGPNEILAKAARAADLPQRHLDLLVRGWNTVAQNVQRLSHKEALAKFAPVPLATREGVEAILFPSAEKRAEARRLAAESLEDWWEEAPRDLYRKFDRPQYVKEAAAIDVGRPLAHSLPDIPSLNGDIAKLEALGRAWEDHRGELVKAARVHDEVVGAIADYLDRQSPPFRPSFADIEKAVLSKQTVPHIEPLMESLHAHHAAGEKRASEEKRGGFLPFDASREPFASFAKLAPAWQDVEKAQTKCAAFLEKTSADVERFCRRWEPLWNHFEADRPAIAPPSLADELLGEPATTKEALFGRRAPEKEDEGGEGARLVPVRMRTLSPVEEELIAQGERRWLPRLLEDDNPSDRLRSPWKAGLLRGLATTALGTGLIHALRVGGSILTADGGPLARAISMVRGVPNSGPSWTPSLALGGALGLWRGISKAREQGKTNKLVRRAIESKGDTYKDLPDDSEWFLVGKDDAPIPLSKAAGDLSLLEPPSRKSAAAGDVFAGTLLSAQAGKLIPPSKTTSEIIDDTINEKLQPPAVQAERRKIQAQTLLSDLMANDDVIAGYAPDQVLQAYNELATMAPRAALSSGHVRPLLRRMLSGNAEPFEIKEIGELEKLLLERERAQQQAASPASLGPALGRR